MKIEVESDAWADSQVASKLWLCETLEQIVPIWKEEPVIWVLGGWYGVLSFLLLSRKRMPIRQIRSFDQDPACETVANLVNNHWLCDSWRFKAFTADCDVLDYTGWDYGPPPDIIINTSTEHFSASLWFEQVPAGAMVAIQNTDMDIDDHHYKVHSSEELEQRFPLTQPYFSSSKRFSYPDKTFDRFMLIGVK